MDSGVRDQYLDAMGIQIYREKGAHSAEQCASAEQPITLTYERLTKNVNTCTTCSSVSIDSRRILAEGQTTADWFVVSHTLTETGMLLSEPSRQLFEGILRSANEITSACYLTSTVKCVQPERAITAKERQNCASFLTHQMRLVRSKVVVLLGEEVAQHVLSTSDPIEQMRGKRLSLTSIDIPIVVTYHPDDLLHSPQLKRAVWQDIQFAKKQVLN